MKLWIKAILLSLLLVPGIAAGKTSKTASSSVLGAFHIDKDEWLMLVQVKTHPEHADTVWQYQDKQYRAKSLILAAPCYDYGYISYSNSSVSGKIKFTTPYKHGKFFNLDQGLKVFAPLLVERGAPIPIYSECFNRWPLDLTMKWERAVSEELPDIKNQSQDISMNPGTANAGRFSPGKFYKEKITIDSTQLPPDKEWSCTYSLSLPGKLLLTRSVRFIPIEYLPELSVNYEGNFTDKTGDIVVPVVTEKKLNERRKWEFFRSIRRYFISGSLLMIAPEMGQRMPQTFSQKLRHEIDNITFLPWPEKESSAQDVAMMLNTVRCTEAETLALVLPPRSRRIGSDQRWLEYANLLVAAAWSRPQMRKVVVIMLPSAPFAAESQEFMINLRNLVRNGDTELLELDGAEFCWDKENIFKPAVDANSESSSLPHAAIPVSSKIIIKSIR